MEPDVTFEFTDDQLQGIKAAAKVLAANWLEAQWIDRVIADMLPSALLMTIAALQEGEKGA